MTVPEILGGFPLAVTAGFLFGVIVRAVSTWTPRG